VCQARKYDHVTHLLRDLHWLRVPERIQFRLAVLAFCCRNHKAPSYLADNLHWTDEAESRHRLRSGSCPRLIVPRTRLSTIGDRSFRVTVAPVLPTSLRQLLYRLSRDNLTHFYLPNHSHHFKLLSHICVPCPRSYLAYATLIGAFYYYYYYYYFDDVHSTITTRLGAWRVYICRCRKNWSQFIVSWWKTLPTQTTWTLLSCSAKIDSLWSHPATRTDDGPNELSSKNSSSPYESSLFYCCFVICSTLTLSPDNVGEGVMFLGCLDRCLSHAFDRLSNHFGFCVCVCVCMYVCPQIGCRTIMPAVLYRFSPKFACRSKILSFRRLLFLGQTGSRSPILEVCKIRLWQFRIVVDIFSHGSSQKPELRYY